MPPIILAQPMLAGIVARLSRPCGGHRGFLFRHVLVHRERGRVAFTGTDQITVHSFCHYAEPEPRTESMRQIEELRWQREAMRFLVPLLDLQAAVRACRARDRIFLTASDVSVQTPPKQPRVVTAFSALDVATFPIIPNLAELPAGWTERPLLPGRVDVMALARKAA